MPDQSPRSSRNKAPSVAQVQQQRRCGTAATLRNQAPRAKPKTVDVPIRSAAAHPCQGDRHAAPSRQHRSGRRCAARTTVLPPVQIRVAYRPSCSTKRKRWLMVSGFLNPAGDRERIIWPAAQYGCRLFVCCFQPWSSGRCQRPLSSSRHRCATGLGTSRVRPSAPWARSLVSVRCPDAKRTDLLDRTAGGLLQPSMPGRM